MAEDVFGIVGTTQAGAFRVESVVAEGGFAVVYRAYHEGFRADVALKCLKIPPALALEHRAEFLDRFREEAELLFRLSAAIPAIVRPLHIGILESDKEVFAPFIALEWLEGRTLDAIVAERRVAGQPPLTLEEAYRLLTPVAQALERAHNFPGPEGPMVIVHRDMKPENLFIADVHGEETVKILDYGIAKVKSATTQIVGHMSVQQDAMVAFTPAYGAPEQWLPKRYGQTGSWTDVWGFAMCVTEAMLGRCPIEGDPPAMMGTIIDPARRPTPRAEGLMVSDAVEQVFQRALAVDPQARYGTVSGFWNELGLAAGLGTQINPVSGSIPAAQRHSDITAAISSAPPAGPPSDPSALQLGRVGARVFDLEDGGSPIAAATPELEGVGLSPARSSAPPGRAVSVRPLASARPLLTPHQVRLSAYDGAEPGWVDKLKTPIALIVIGVMLMVGDWLYASATHTVFSLGPVRTFWLAGPLVLGGIGLLFYRLLAQPDE